MAKRFTDTNKWKKKWIRGLAPNYKLFWVFICDDCNHAGIWDVDIEVANLRLGLDLKEEEILKVFGDKIVVLDGGNKWFLPTFIEFQYGELNPENRVHQSVLTILHKEGAYKPLTRTIQGRKDKDKNKDKNKDNINIKKYPYFTDISFINAYKDYLDMRKKIRKPATKRAEVLVLNTLHKYPVDTAIKMLEQSVINSWQGVFELKKGKKEEPVVTRGQGTEALDNFKKWEKEARG